MSYNFCPAGGGGGTAKSSAESGLETPWFKCDQYEKYDLESMITVKALISTNKRPKSERKLNRRILS